jgi:hypothetical protein
MRLHSTCGLALMSTLVAFLVPVSLVGPQAGAQDPVTPNVKKDVSANRIEEMRRTVKAFETVAIEGEKRIPVPLEREPLHRWTDPTRGKPDGALWVWRSSGRPVAGLAIELNLENLSQWSFEFVSLSTRLVESADHTLRWTPQKPGVVFQEIPGAPAPAASETARLRQIRDLAKRFSATEFWDVTSQHYGLRMLPHPIDRYHDAASGLIDGAIFIFANGTNPEVFLLIEATRRGNGPPKWTYAAAPLTTAAPTLQLDRKDVWTSPNKYGYLSREPYFFGTMRRDQAAP